MKREMSTWPVGQTAPNASAIRRAAESRALRRGQAAVTGADAPVVCTEWKQFRVVKFTLLKRSLALPVAVDSRNLWDPGDVRDARLLYLGVGRGASWQRSGIDRRRTWQMADRSVSWVTSPLH